MCEPHPISNVNYNMRSLSESIVGRRSGLPSALLILLIALLATSCVKNEFTLQFKLDANVNTTCRIVYYGSDSRGGILVESAIAIAAGKGDLTGITKNPCMVALYAGKNVLPSCVMFAERGDKLEISGSGSNPLDWTVEGGKVNARLTEWRLANRQLIDEALKARNEHQEATRRKLNARISEYVEKNPGAVESLMIMSAWYDSSIDPKEFKALTAKMQESGVMDEYPSFMVRQDLLSGVAAVASEGDGLTVSDMVVKGRLTNIDTLRLKSGDRPGLLYIWTRNAPGRKGDMDSIRTILKLRGDSARMTVADICLEPDSTLWVYALRGDTLRQSVRAWMPRGIADPALMELGVAAVPWWVVTDRKGRVVYTGAGAAQAMESVRKLLETK